VRFAGKLEVQFRWVRVRVHYRKHGKLICPSRFFHYSGNVLEDFVDAHRVDFAAVIEAVLNGELQKASSSLRCKIVRNHLAVARFLRNPRLIGHGDPQCASVHREANIGRIGMASCNGDDRAFPNAVLRFSGPAIDSDKVFIHGSLRVAWTCSGGKAAGKLEGMSFVRTYLIVSFALVASFAVSAHAQAPKPKPDVLVFTNGDQLTGKLERVAGGSAVFQSDMAGELTISFDKIKQLNSSTEFVAIVKGHHKKPELTSGTVQVAGSNIVIHPVNTPSAALILTTKNVDYLVDRPTYEKQLHHEPNFFHAWNGTVTGGASLVRSTQTSTSLTAGVALVRTVPTVPYMPPRNRTTVNVTEAYGTSTTPGAIPQTTPVTPDVTVKTSIFHADAERDEYFQPRFYALVDTSQDHDFSQGLKWQQVYGGGIGWTAVKSPVQELDVKAEVHYEKQQYFSPVLTAGVVPGPPQPDANFIGSTIGENYTRQLPRKMVFTETGTYLPAWSELHDYAANISATLAMPVFKRLSLSITTTDNYLNDPQVGYQKNSYQFVTGVTYNLH
jgi:hypothetical protein